MKIRKKRSAKGLFKRLIPAVLSLSLLACTSGTASAASFTIPKRPDYFGNVDLKNGVNTADALLALQYAVGKVTLEYEQLLRANVTPNESIGTDDALAILQYAVGKIDVFPCEQVFIDEIEEMSGENPLRFDSEGNFRLLQISDPQITKGADTANAKTIEAVNALIDENNPDFVMFSGDLTSGYSTADEFKTAVASLTAKLENEKIPWAHVYGQSDALDNTISKTEQQKIYESFTYCHSTAGKDTVTGVGNYMLPVLNSHNEIAFNIWALDTGSALSEREDGIADGAEDVSSNLYPTGNEDFVDFTQLLWYYNTSCAVEQLYGKPIPGILFGNVPFQEFQIIKDNPLDGYMQGYANEAVTGSKLNSGLFTALFERGDVLGYYCGHNHTNNFSGKYCGVNLGYAGSVGYAQPHKESVMGGRVFDIHESDPSAYTTYFSYLKDIDEKFTTEMTDEDWKLNATAYKIDNKNIMLSDFDSITGIEKGSAINKIVSDPKTQGTGALQCQPLASNYLAAIKYGYGLDLKNYNYISMDVYLGKAYTGSNGTLGLDFTTGTNTTGFHGEIKLAELNQGWNTITLCAKDLEGSANWSSINNIYISWNNADSMSIAGFQFVFDNLKIYNPEITYSIDEDHLMINNFETDANTSDSFNTAISTDSEHTQGFRSLKMEPKSPLGNGASVGGMIYYSPAKALDLTPYQYISLDLYVSTECSGTFQINFATYGADGFNHGSIDLAALNTGWNHIVIEREAVGMAANADWANIATLRFTWFNYAQQNNGCYFLIDNLVAYN